MKIQIGCMKNQKISISFDVKKLYVVSLKNKKNIIVFEMINIAKHYSFFF